MYVRQALFLNSQVNDAMILLSYVFVITSMKKVIIASGQLPLPSKFKGINLNH